MAWGGVPPTPWTRSSVTPSSGTWGHVQSARVGLLSGGGGPALSAPLARLVGMTAIAPP